MQIIFFATSAFAVPSLERLVTRRQDVVVCVTQPDRPQGRGLRVLPSAVKSAALRLGLSVEEPRDLRAALPSLRRHAPDLGVVISYGRLIPPELLSWPRHGMLGVHPSLLPRYRGASPMARAILHGDSSTGVTIFRLNERMDAGDIACQREVVMDPQETAETLSERLSRLGAELLLETVERIEQGTAAFHPQDDSRATDAPKFTKAEGRIDWGAGAEAIHRLVRAAGPWPGAYTNWKEGSLKVWATRYNAPIPLPAARDGARPGSGESRAGEVIAASADGIAVRAKDGVVIIEELQPAGSRRMSVREFLAGHPMQVGDILGG